MVIQSCCYGRAESISTHPHTLISLMCCWCICTILSRSISSTCLFRIIITPWWSSSHILIALLIKSLIWLIYITIILLVSTKSCRQLGRNRKSSLIITLVINNCWSTTTLICCSIFFIWCSKQRIWKNSNSLLIALVCINTYERILSTWSLSNFNIILFLFTFLFSKNIVNVFWYWY